MTEPDNTLPPRIVVIDDNDLMRETLYNMLEATGFRVVTSEGGDDGIREVAREGADIVITDILMPEKDGLETIRELRRVFPGVRIIAMSGGGKLASPSYLDNAKHFGADALLPKPFTVDELYAAIRQCGFEIARDRQSGAC